MLQDNDRCRERIIQEILNTNYMASVNKILLIGCVGKDPDIRTFESGAKVASFTLATDESYTDRSGNRQTQTEWHNITLPGKIAEVAERFIRKGSQVFVEGKVRTRSWDDQNGQKHYQTEVVGLSLQLLDPKPQQQAQTAPQQYQQPMQTQYQQYAPAGYPGAPQNPQQQSYAPIAMPPQAPAPQYQQSAPPPASAPQPPMQQQLDPNNYPGDLQF